jgi:uncharacterized membrane protein
MIRPLRRLETVILLAILLGYFAYYLTAGWLKAENFVLGKRDSAIYQTALWQAGQLENPITYVVPGTTSLPFVGGHFMPIGFVYGLIYRVFPSVHTTVAIYAVSFTIAGFFVYLLARRLTSSGAIALGLLITYLAVFTPGLNHFYFEDWATPYIAAALYFTIKRRYGWASAMWLLAAMFKEYISLAPAVFGLFAWLTYLSFGRKQLAPADRSGRWGSSQGRFGLLWAGMGLLWFSLAFFGIMRWFQPVWGNMGLFSELGDSYSSVAFSVLSRPGLILQRMAEPLGREYLTSLFLPLAFLPLLGLEYTVAILPILFLNFLPGNGHAIRNGINGHYTTMIQPVVLAGAAAGIVRLKSWINHRPRSLQIALVTVLTLIIALHAAQGVRYHIYKLRESLVCAHTLALHTQDVKAVLSLIPPDASVAAEENLLPFLSHRRVVAHLGNVKAVRPEYLVRDTFYATGLIRVLERGLNLRWKMYEMYNYPASDYYDPQVWERSTSVACECVGYTMVYRRGSVGLFVKRSGAQKTSGSSATACGANAGGE